MTTSTSNNKSGTSFARSAAQQRAGFLVEFWDFLIHNKKWWITPAVVVLLLLGGLLLAGGGAAAPFIYALF